MLCTAGGCTGPCGDVPVVLLPVYGAALPVVGAARAIDDHSPQRSNARFVIGGQVVDQRGLPVDGVEAEVVAWVATHRHDGGADRWEQRTERYPLASPFRLEIKDAQALDIHFRRVGYRDQRIVFVYGDRPPFVHVRFDTFRPWDNQVPHPGPPINSANLEDGGTLYEGYKDVRPVRKEDLRIVMSPQ